MKISTKPASKDETERNVNKSKLFDSNIAGNFPAVKLATADERNQKPIIREAIFLGDTLETIESPIGERHSSPIVCKK